MRPAADADARPPAFRFWPAPAPGRPTGPPHPPPPRCTAPGSPQSQSPRAPAAPVQPGEAAGRVRAAGRAQQPGRQHTSSGGSAGRAGAAAAARPAAKKTHLLAQIEVGHHRRLPNQRLGAAQGGPTAAGRWGTGTSFSRSSRHGAHWLRLACGARRSSFPWGQRHTLTPCMAGTRRPQSRMSSAGRPRSQTTPRRQSRSSGRARWHGRGGRAGPGSAPAAPWGAPPGAAQAGGQGSAARRGAQTSISPSGAAALAPPCVHCSCNCSRPPAPASALSRSAA